MTKAKEREICSRYLEGLSDKEMHKFVFSLLNFTPWSRYFTSNRPRMKGEVGQLGPFILVDERRNDLT